VGELLEALEERGGASGGHLDSWHGGTGATNDAAGGSGALRGHVDLAGIRSADGPNPRVALWEGTRLVDNALSGT
jgi:hypothetical protein